ncbi:MAG: PSD1 domain-containing protein [Verrucomicrobia bacterium]|nr:PSD1 domain-containing protein [Verrucomicrobiota bacterium]
MEIRSLLNGQRLGLLWLLAILALLAASASGATQPARKKTAIDFNRDIRPILSENCFACHGPDENKRKAKLRLDQKDGLFKTLDKGKLVVVPGSSKQSDLFRRITATDEDDHMPPPKFGKALTKAQIELLRQWIDEGAEWKGHWAYLAPERPELPAVKNKSWPRNAIDHFVLARLEKEGLKPTSEADRLTLIRRLTFDLTGLPPTIEEVDAFLSNKNPDAYEKLVDRLLASAQYGERMAEFWLDLARYADTNGYHIDNNRDIWLWREWVIRAFNENMPFDRFTIEQLAGDLLPNATMDQKVATGFNRNEMVNFEGGADPDEYLTKYQVGRVDTTATVWLGITLACTECHDHKYDPFTQKDFYKFYAFFNSIAEKGLDGQKDNPAPSIKVPSPEQKVRWDELRDKAAVLDSDLKKQLETPHKELDLAQAKWEDEIRKKVLTDWSVVDPAEFTSAGGATLKKLDDKSVLAGGTNPDKETYEVILKTPLDAITGIRLEALADASFPAKSSRSENGNFVLTAFEAEAEVAPSGEASSSSPESPEFGVWHVLGPFKAASAKEAFSKAFISEAEIDLTKTYDEGKLKWVDKPDWKDGMVQSLGSTENAATYLYRTIIVKSARQMMISLGSDDGIQVWFNGRKLLANDVARGVAADQEKLVLRLAAGENKLLLKINNGGADYAYYFAADKNPVTKYPVQFASAVADVNQKDFNVQSALEGKPNKGWAIAGYEAANQVDHQAVFIAKQPFGFAEGTKLKVRLKFDSDFKQHAIGRFRLAVTTSDGLVEFAALPDNVRNILPLVPEKRTEAQKTELTKYYRETFVPEVQTLKQQLTAKRDELNKFEATIPSTMVMQDLEKPRETHVLVRGDFRNKGELVAPGTPASLPPLPAGAPVNRLALARWLVSPDNPLTSRVTMNRLWAMFFGTGIVKTSNNFGVQGEWPSHPHLLDWLGTEFIAQHWDIKAMQKMMVMSATYRQSAKVTKELVERDPENRLYARGPRFRLDAEMIHDNALAVSGLLNRKIGGPSVRPYQPPGLWEQVGFGDSFSSQSYVQSKGEDLYRRGLYTYWKRAMPYPAFVTFDAPSREVCTVQRPRTSTPLQSLILMNDPVYVEAARGLAARVMKNGGDDVAKRLTYAFRLTLARPPKKNELEALERIYQQQLQNYRQDKAAAEALLSVSESPRPTDLDVSELAAWTAIGNILLNLDETITKG